MTDENNSDTPTDDTEQHPRPQPEPLSPTVKQGEIGTQANQGTDAQQATSKELAREFRWIEFSQLIVNSVLVIITAFVLWVYYGQLKEMRKSTKAAQDAADAANSAAVIANKTRKLSYRPRITLLGINTGIMQSMKDGKLITTLDKGRLQVGVTPSNTGPFAARNVRFFRFDNLSRRDQLQKLPCEELMGELKVIPPNTTGYNREITIFGNRPINKLSALQSGTLWATFSIMIVYDDDFGETHHTEFCEIFTLQPSNDICPWPVQND